MMVPISSTRRPARGPATDSSSATDVMVDILSGNDRSPGTTALRERPKGTFARSTRPKVPFARKPERAGSAAREPDDQDDQREHAHAGRDRDEALGERGACDTGCGPAPEAGDAPGFAAVSLALRASATVDAIGAASGAPEPAATGVGAAGCETDVASPDTGAAPEVAAGAAPFDAFDDPDPDAGAGASANSSARQDANVPRVLS